MPSRQRDQAGQEQPRHCDEAEPTALLRGALSLSEIPAPQFSGGAGSWIVFPARNVLRCISENHFSNSFFFIR
jgi:hypothetical protein